METWKYIVYGKVQGVGYRNAVNQFVHAETYDICGHVRNLSNGTVEVLIQGDREQMRKIEEFLYRGSARCKVNHIDKIQLHGLEEATPFHIDY